MNTAGDEVTTWASADELRDDFYAIRVEADRALDDEHARHLFGLIGYAFRQHMRGESLGEPQRVSDRVFIGHYDSTKSRSDDWSFHLDDAVADAQRYVIEGTPPRKTKRYGPLGSRLIEGLGDVKIKILFG